MFYQNLFSENMLFYQNLFGEICRFTKIFSVIKDLNFPVSR